MTVPEVHAKRIIEGKEMLKDVPYYIRDQVKFLLIKRNHAELTEEN